LSPSQDTSEEVILFEVSVPGDAELTIDGKKTDSTGETRTFQTPPLKEGKRYHYTLVATAGGKEVKREIHISYGAANAFDLRPDFQAAGREKPKATALAHKPAESAKPNILFIMGDDIGWMQPSCYHRGLMVGETPNIDRIAREGAIFMDYVAMQSC